jgi:hypothetical protein
MPMPSPRQRRAWLADVANRILVFPPPSVQVPSLASISEPPLASTSVNVELDATGELPAGHEIDTGVLGIDELIFVLSKSPAVYSRTFHVCEGENKCVPGVRFVNVFTAM